MTWKQPKYPLTDKEMKKWYPYIIEYYIAIKENGPHERTPRPRMDPRPRRGGYAGEEGPRGATPRSRSGGVAVRRYPSSKVRSSAALCWSSCEEIPHVQGTRN